MYPQGLQLARETTAVQSLFVYLNHTVKSTAVGVMKRHNYDEPVTGAGPNNAGSFDFRIPPQVPRRPDDVIPQHGRRPSKCPGPECRKTCCCCRTP